jgi:hypothetical protein
MLNDTILSAHDLWALEIIGKTWVCASYWEDETIRRYRTLGLLSCDGSQIRLTEAGKRAGMPPSTDLRAA